MRLRATTILTAVVLAFFAATPGWAALVAYSQDFEGMIQSDPNALSSDGWLFYVNVFDAVTWGHMYGYGGPAPNGPQICAVAAGEGGPDQGAQQLSVYSDYNNGDHANGHHIETNVFQERWLDADDVGETWVMTFDAKLGNLGGATTAAAFIKTLDPNAGWAMTNYVTTDMTLIPTTWGTYSVELMIDATLVGQVFQFGFTNNATNYEGSGVFYDNVNFEEGGPVSVDAQSWAATKALYR